MRTVHCNDSFGSKHFLMCCLSLCVFVLVSAPRPRFPPLGPVLAPRPQRHLAEDSARAILPRACSFRERSKRQLQCLEFSNISANFVFSSNARNTRACVSNLVSSSFAKHFYRHSLFLSFIASRYLLLSLSLSSLSDVGGLSTATPREDASRTIAAQGSSLGSSSQKVVASRGKR